MSDSLHNQIKNIKTDIGKISKKVSYEVSKQASEDLYYVHMQIVDNFYSAYNPSSYDRYGNLYNSSIEQNPVEKGNGYISGLVVGSFNMNDVYNISPDNVFDLFWNKGVRGLPKIGSKVLDDGKPWSNPTWESQYGEYENVFKTSITLGSYTTKVGTPHQVMEDITNHWKEASGANTCEKVISKIKNGK